MRIRCLLILFLCLFLGRWSMASEQDPDLDGFPTDYEELLLTDPFDANSRPTLADNQWKILAWWPLFENAEEALGTGLDGILKNGAKFRQDVLSLDGKNDYINFGNSEPLNITNDLSYCLWLRPEGQIGLRRVLGKFKTKGSNRSFATFIGGGDRIWTFISEDGTPRRRNSVIQATGKNAIAKNNWQHLAVTWSVTNDLDGLSTYIDALPLKMYGRPASAIDSINDSQADLTLGSYDIRNLKHKWKKKEIVRNAFKGKMAQLILCDGTLTELEVNEIYLLGRNADLLSYINADYDLDNMLDWWERQYFQDISQTAQDDFDSDGLANIDEQTHETIPTNYDTDEDQLSDGQEVHTWNTDPLNQDSDNDGIMDGAEVLSGTDPTNSLSYLASISGSMEYTGEQIGPVKIIAAADAASWSSQYFMDINDPGSYTLPNIPNLTDYWLKAFRDSNRNGVKEAWEAHGFHVNNPVYLENSVSGKDIPLTDPDLDSDEIPDWWEVAYLGHINAHPQDDPDKDGVNNLSEYHSRTDPQNQDTDRDGWKDGEGREVEVSRAFIEWGQPEFTQGDDYIYTAPSWLKRAHKIGGEWIYLSVEVPGVPGLRSSTLQSTTLTADPQVLTISSEALTEELQQEETPVVSEEDAPLYIGGEELYLGKDWLIRKYQKHGQKYTEQYNAPISTGQKKWLVRNNPLLLPMIEYLTPEGKFSKKGPHFNPAEWHVPATEPDGVGSLNIEIDRAIVTGNLQMQIQFKEHPGGTLYVDLLTTNYATVASDLYGNINAGSDTIVTKDYTVPLASYPATGVIRLRRGTGEATVGILKLWIDQDGDTLDAGQEAILGTSDLPVTGLDSDNDGVNDNIELDQGTDPANTASFLTTVSGDVSYGGAETGNVYIALCTNASYSGKVYSAFISTLGAYTVNDVPTLTNYYVRSWVDFNNNGSYDAWEPQGNYAGNPYYLAGAPVGIDITLADMPDSDGDGLADAWEQRYWTNATVAVPTEDPDGDTLNNLAEYYKGTDPRNEDSNGDGVNDAGRYAKIKLLPLEVSPAGITLRVGYPDAFTNRLDIFSSTDLNNKTGWNLDATANVSGATNILGWLKSDLSGTDRIFFKVYNADYDQDGDGLADGREKLVYGTGVDNPDTDGDDMPDGWEIANNFDPQKNDAYQDLDGDGLKNITMEQDQTRQMKILMASLMGGR